MSSWREPDAWRRVLDAAERAEWRLDAVLEEGATLDFSRPFLPAALTGERDLAWQHEREGLALNQVRAHGYLGLFGIVEEMITGHIDQALAAQVRLDRLTLEVAIGRRLDEAEAHAFLRLQHASQRRTFLTCGMQHPRFLASLAAVAPGAPERVRRAAQTLESSSSIQTARALELDLRGAFGLDPSVAPGAERVRYALEVKGDANREQFAEIHAEMIARSPNRWHLAQPVALDATLIVR